MQILQLNKITQYSKRSLIIALLMANSLNVFSQGDTPCAATNLIVNSNCSYTLGTTVGKAYQANANNGGTPTCASPGAPDVWYQFVAPVSGSVTITTDVAGITDGGMSLYNGPCGSPTQIVCDDDGGPGLMPMITQTGLTPGVSYWIRFWAYGGTNTGTFNICITQGPTPATNNECAVATTLTVNPDYLCGIVTSGTVLGATASANAIAPCGGTANDDVWYSFVATSTSHRVSLTNVLGSTTDMYHAIYSGSCGVLVNISCNDGDQSDLTGLTIGATYYLRVYTSTATIGQTSTFNVCVGTAPPPPTCPGGLGTGVTNIAALPYNSGAQTTCGAINDLTSSNIATICGSSSYYGGEDVVYVFTPATTGSITINVASSGTYMGAMLYDGCPFSSGTCSWSAQSSAGNQDGCVSVVAGHTYYLIIDSWASPNCNPYTLNISAISVGGIVNDNCSGATPLPVNATCIYTNSTNTCASATIGIPAPGCGNYVGGDVWFSAVVPASGNMQFDGQAGTMADGAMALYTGTCTSLALVTCDDNSSSNFGMPNITRTGLLPGSTVYIRFWEYGNDALGTFGICAHTYVPPIPNNQDCLGAIPITQNTYSCTYSYSGTGNILGEINPVLSCLGAGEKNDVWYTFTVQTSGNLNFTINPNNNTNDYDWAVFNLTYNNCQDIKTNASLAASCSFIGSTTVYNNASCTTTIPSEQGNTGPNGYFLGCNTLNEPVIPVIAGETYVINVSQYSASVDGYTIDFGASTALLFDTIPSPFSSINTPIPCGATSINVSFSKNIKCNTVSIDDFSLIGPDTNYTITSISSANCVSGATYDSIFTITISPPISANGIFTLSLLPVIVAGSISDTAGNILPPDSYYFTINNLTSTTSQSNVLCYGASTGQASVYGSGGTSFYSYLWSTGATTQTISGLAAGIYAVTTSDIGGCPFISTVTITQPSVLGNTFTSTNPTCYGFCDGVLSTSITGGTLPYSYQWNDPILQTTQTAIALCTGSYSVTISDANNCTLVATNLIGQSPQITTSAITGDSHCNQSDGAITLTVTNGVAPFTFIWSNAANTQNLAGVPAGSYSVTITDVNGCTGTGTYSINNLSGPVASITPSTNILCFGQCIGEAIAGESGGTAPFTYLWDNSQTSQTGTSLCAGMHSATVTDAHGCAAIAYISLTQPPLLTTEINNSTNVSCLNGNNGYAQINVTGGSPGYSLIWSNSEVTESISNLIADVYFVTVTDINGCTSSSQVTITEPPALSVSLSEINETCFNYCDGQIFSTATGGTIPYTYTWSNNQNTANIDHLCAGAYILTVVDINGCSNTASIVITSNPLPILIITNPSEVCSPNVIDISSSTITTGSSMGTLSYWQDPSASISLIPTFYTAIDTSGTYYIKLDSAGCYVIEPITINIREDCVWPGDADNDKSVSNFDLLPIGLYYGQTGFARSIQSNTWQSFLSDNWGTIQQNGFDIKHIDCNGDGSINNSDTLAINLNFSFSHSKANKNLSYKTYPDLYFVTTNNTYFPGDWVNLDIMAGNSSNPVNNLYGIAFNINFDTSLIQPGTGCVNYPNSWFATPGTNSIKFSSINESSNTVYAAETRINHISIDGYGLIATFRFKLKSTISSSTIMNFYFSDYLSYNSSGDSLYFNLLSDTIQISTTQIIVDENTESDQLLIYPNPNNGKFTIEFTNPETKSNRVTITDFTGKIIYETTLKTEKIIFQEFELASGVYFVKVTGNKVYNKKLIIK
ncbi:MAG: T9SS type A sorting domain-containing protein [Bacteroidia bacterium]|nr:T9SS type A sorting domain-containing protein [Bacteroidia bacterium]